MLKSYIYESENVEKIYKKSYCEMTESNFRVTETTDNRLTKSNN